MLAGIEALNREYQYAMVLFDHEGCGQENERPEALATEVRTNLARNGWSGRAEVVVIAPELEIWVWTRSLQVDHCLDWSDRRPPLRDWLSESGYWPADVAKLPDPKGAMEAALRDVRKSQSSAIYLELAQTVSLQGHTEPAFVHLSQTLRRWFPASE